MEDYFSPKTIGEVDITNEEYALEIIPNDHDNYYPYGPDAIQAAFNLRKPLSPAFSPNLVHNRDAAISTRDRISRSSTLGDEGSMLSGSPCNYHDAWPQRNPGLQIPDIPKFDEAAVYYPPYSLSPSSLSSHSPRSSSGWSQSSPSRGSMGGYGSSPRSLRSNTMNTNRRWSRMSERPQSSRGYYDSLRAYAPEQVPFFPNYGVSTSPGSPEGYINSSPHNVRADDMSFFNGATNSHFHSPVQNVVGDVTTTIYSSGRTQLVGRDSLRQSMSPNALYSGGGDYDENPQCHPETRLCITSDIQTWVLDSKRLHNILWMSGPPGTGKSAIARTSAGKLDSQLALAASFFFWRLDDTRNTPKRFVSTIADRLAVWNEGICAYIDWVLRRDPLVLEGNMAYQWQKLIVEPVLAASELPPAVIIIDGLDECGTARDQEKILELITSCNNDRVFPIAFLITSRPESHLKAAFEEPILSAFCRERIVLGDTKDSRQDMRTYLASAFSTIRRHNRDILGSNSESWPPKQVHDKIIKYSSGQFMYPKTILKFIDDGEHDPRIRLDEILNSQEVAIPGAFSALDILYRLILKNSGFLHNETIQRILFLLVLSTQPRRMYSIGHNFTKISWIIQILEQNLSNIRLSLRRLHSVLDIPESDAQSHCIRYYHLSFGDFLLDRRRSGEFFIDTSRHSAILASHALTKLSNMLHESGPDKSNFINISLIWMFFSCYVDSEQVPEHLIQAMVAFEFITWLEAYAQQPYSLCECFDEYIYHVNTWQPNYRPRNLPSSSRNGKLSALDHARCSWYTRLCSGHEDIAKLYYLFLSNIITKGATVSWTGINVLIGIYHCIYGGEASKWPSINDSLGLWAQYIPETFWNTFDKSLRPEVRTNNDLGFTRGVSRDSLQVIRVTICIIVAIAEDDWRELLSVEDILKLLACDWGYSIKCTTPCTVDYTELRRVVPNTFKGFHRLLSELEVQEPDSFSSLMLWKLVKASFLSGGRRQRAGPQVQSILAAWCKIIALQKMYSSSAV